MVKKALCVGCNYTRRVFGLSGAVNDAFLLADCLQRKCGFEPENVCVLHDEQPGRRGRKVDVDASKLSTRSNILQQLQLLVRQAKSGDVLFFSFSGYGVLIEDIDAPFNEGFSEAILPSDYTDGFTDNYSVLLVEQLHDIITRAPTGCMVVVLMDCDHGTSVVDVAGTLDGKLVPGLQYTATCGIGSHSTKVQLAERSRAVWHDKPAHKRRVRPRFKPPMLLAQPHRGQLPTRPGMSRATAVVFCYSAAVHGQTSIEMQMPHGLEGHGEAVQHGVLTMSFVRALQTLSADSTHLEILSEMQRHLAETRQILPSMDQEVLLTFTKPHSNPSNMKVFQPLQIKEKPKLVEPESREASQEWRIVPPPPPGFVSRLNAVADSAEKIKVDAIGPYRGKENGRPRRQLLL